jgi:sugar/nucleoside kinase (ribokinase family)
VGVGARVLPRSAVLDVVVVGGVFREILNGDTSPRARLGGSGVTAAVTSARLGAKTALVSYVGEEDASAAFSMLGSSGVDTESVLVLPGASGTFVFPSAAGGRPWPMYRPAEAVPGNRPEVPEAAVYVVFGIPDFDPVAAGWTQVLSEDAILIWDRQGWISRARDSKPAGALRPRRKVYVANVEEVLEEFPAESEGAAMLALPPARYTAAIVKRGTRGCVVIEIVKGTRRGRTIAAATVHVGSTIGSGDAFAGGLAFRLAKGWSVEEGALAGNAAAGALLEAQCDPFADSVPERSRALMAEQGAEPSHS